VCKKYPVVGFIKHNSGKIYPQVCKLKAKGKKKEFFLIYTFSFELSAKIATGSTPD
jgi:hypothetical protein